jgi:hypothetical protein
MKCKICDHTSDYLFNKKILNKYDVKYHRCTHCLFIQTEEPYWLSESYASAITSLDIGLIHRNLNLARVTQAVILKYFNPEKRFLDFGGGFGLFVRLMRDNGINFYRQDKFCENLFAKHFDIEDLENKSAFELLTAFELFEHLQNPLQSLDEMLSYSKNIFFSTELTPNENVSDWWYIVPEVGQHVAFYHYRSLLELGRRHNLHVYSNMSNIHMFSEKKINPWVFKQLCRPKISTIYSYLFSPKNSLLPEDFKRLRSQLNQSITEGKQ